MSIPTMPLRRLAASALSWWRPWAASALAGIVVFGIFHQFLVDWAPIVPVFGAPMALVLSIPIVVAYAAANRPNGSLFGVVVFAGFVPHYALVTVGMWGRTFDDGPRAGFDFLAAIAAAVVSGILAWYLWRSGKATGVMAVAVFCLTFMSGGFQFSEPDLRNLGAFISLLPACVVAGWVLGHPRLRPGPQLAVSRSGGVHEGDQSLM